MKFNSYDDYLNFNEFNIDTFIVRNISFESSCKIWNFHSCNINSTFLLDYDFNNQICKIQTLIEYKNFFKNEFKEMIF